MYMSREGHDNINRFNHGHVSLGNKKCKYARFFANITGKMQIIKDYQLY